VLCVGRLKPSRDITSYLDQLSLPSLWGRLTEYQPFWLGLGGAEGEADGVIDDESEDGDCDEVICAG